MSFEDEIRRHEIVEAGRIVFRSIDTAAALKNKIVAPRRRAPQSSLYPFGRLFRNLAAQQPKRDSLPAPGALCAPLPPVPQQSSVTTATNASPSP